MRIKLGAHSHYEDQGTDIYIKKLDQGAGYGTGYHVEVYDYGQKVFEKTVKTKKDIRRIINEQKDKYKTDRAFEEESHLFVSYRIDDVESKKFRKQNDLTVKESIMNIEEKLYKQASRINNILSIAKDPEVPIKFFKYADAMFDFNKENPIENTEQQVPTNETIQEKDSVDTAAQQISEKIDAYLTKTQQSPRDDIYNSLEKFISKTVKPILANAGYSDDERKQIVTILANKYKNSDIANADLLFKAASTRYANPIQQSILQPNTLKPLGNTELQKDSTLSPEAANLVDKINTLNGDPLSIYDTISQTPNNVNLVNEIKQKQTQVQPTQAVNSILSYKANYTEALYKYAGHQITKFYSDIKSLKGVYSFNTTFKKWASAKKYSSLQEYVINMRKASFIETASYQLNNKGKLPEDFPFKQASEKTTVFYLVKCADFASEGAENSGPLVDSLQYLFFTALKGLQNNPEMSPQEYANQVIAQYNNTPQCKLAVIDVISQYIEYAYHPTFRQVWYAQRLKNNSKENYKKLIDAFWDQKISMSLSKVISPQVGAAIGRVINKTAEGAINTYPQYKEYFDVITQEFIKSIHSCLLNNEVLMEGAERAKNDALDKWMAKDVNIIKSNFNSNQKHAVNIIINESPSGASEVKVEDDLGNIEPIPSSTEPNTEDFGISPLEENTQKPIEPAPINEQADVNSESANPSLFDDLAL